MPLFLAPLMNTVGYAALGGLLAAVVFGGVQTYRLTLARADVATARQHEAEYAGQASKVNEIFAREEAKREHDRAEQTRKNSEEMARLTNERDAIETRFKNVSADRAKIAAENIRFRNNAPKTDSRPVGPTMVRVLNCLRQQQQAFRSGGASPAC